ncbi:MAG TPA: hypothetical protein VNN80_16700, partial [Polyangiaceae bacterium]|nr:hypothetical protein [Polyangiaceae bacterium]
RVATEAFEVGTGWARACLPEGIDGEAAVVYRREATAGATVGDVAAELGMKSYTRALGRREVRIPDRLEQPFRTHLNGDSEMT